MDTHATVRMLTGTAEEPAVAMVDAAQNAVATDHGRELATRPDLDRLREVQRADLATLRPGRYAHARESGHVRRAPDSG